MCLRASTRKRYAGILRLPECSLSVSVSHLEGMQKPCISPESNIDRLIKEEQVVYG